MRIPIVFARIAWMRWYEGSPNEITYPRSLQEAENFRSIQGRVYGFAQPVTNGRYRATVKLERIVPGCGGNGITGVTVVFVARAPRGGQRVVGWYRDAVVHRVPQMTSVRRYEYYFETTAKNAVLVPEKSRSCIIPAGLGAFGKSNLWYLYEKDGAAKNAAWVSAVLDYIQDSSCDSLASPARRRNSELQREVR